MAQERITSAERQLEELKVMENSAEELSRVWANILKKAYDALKNAGFCDEEAITIIAVQGTKGITAP